MTTRSNGGTVPASRRAQQSSSVSTRSPRIVQHRQPVCSVDEALLAGLDQVVVEPDLAELVDDHRRARELRVPQQARQQRGLAAAEKARQHRRRGSWRQQRQRRDAQRGSAGSSGSMAPRTARSKPAMPVTPRVRSPRANHPAERQIGRRRARCASRLSPAATAAPRRPRAARRRHAPGRQALRQQLHDMRRVRRRSQRRPVR